MESYKKFSTSLSRYIKKFPHLTFLSDIFSESFFNKIKSIKSLKVGTDCSGIEAPITALELLNIPYDHIFSCEIDENCRQVIELNYNCKTLYENIKKRDHSNLSKLDFYVAGFPCQAFSGLVSDAMGFDDPRGTIFFECYKTIKYTKPKFFILENVRGLITHDNGNTFKVILKYLKKLKDYNIYYKVLNTKDYNIPQNRPRVYIVGIQKKYGDHFKFPEKIKSTVSISDIMDKSLKNDEEKLTKNMKLVVKNRLKKKSGDKKNNYIINTGVSVNGGFGSAMLEISPCLLAGSKYFFSTKYNRFLSDREHLRLQGFPDYLKTIDNPNITKKQAGNSMSVNVICFLLKNIIEIVY